MFERVFWKDAAERAASTAAQAALLVVGSDVVNVFNVNVLNVLGFAAGGAVLSVLKALAAKRVGHGESASLVPELAVVDIKAPAS